MNYIRINGIVIDSDLIDTIEITNFANNLKVKVRTLDGCGFEGLFPLPYPTKTAYEDIRYICMTIKDELQRYRKAHEYESGRERK